MERIPKATYTPEFRAEAVLKDKHRAGVPAPGKKGRVS